MSHTNQMPIFNLKAVVHETGIKPDTLRAWERRYGIPAPQRTESGHRLYTQRDIDILKWLISRQDEGLSISRAVALWQRSEKEGNDPLREQETAPLTTLTREPLRRTPQTTSATSATQHEPATRVQALRDQWIAAVLAFDEQAADAALANAFGLFSPESVCIDLLQKGLAIMGEGWYQGRVTVQQEHFASALAIRRLDSLLASTPPPTRPGRILVGCPPEESHTFVLLMLSLLLRRKGWNVIYLGADVPVESLEITITTTRPDLVVLIAQQLHTVVGLAEMAEVLRKKQIPLGFGGLIFNRFDQLQRIIPGYFLGYELPEAIHAVEQIMAAPRPKPADESVPQRYAEARAHYQEKRARIEADVWTHLEHGNLPQHHLTAGNANFGRSIQAALALGNMNYLGSDIKWLQELLHNHYQMPRYVINEYLRTYTAAAHRHLNHTGQPLLDWLTHIGSPRGEHTNRIDDSDADTPPALSTDALETVKSGNTAANMADPEHDTIDPKADPKAMHQMSGPRQKDSLTAEYSAVSGNPRHVQNTPVADGRLYRAVGAQNGAAENGANSSSDDGPGRSLHDGNNAGS